MLSQVALQCPWCGEHFDTRVDGSAGGAEYVEDCPVCCRPMVIRFEVDADGQPLALQVDRE